MPSHPLVSIFLFAACVLGGWLAILGVVYAGLWSATLHRFGTIYIFLINVGASILLSPGVVVGHGILPFPVGLAVLFGEQDPRDRSTLVFNFILWMCTLAFFIILSLWLRKRDSSKAKN